MHPTYPYILMNHLALMLIMLKKRFFFPKQVEALLGAKVQVIPPHFDVDPNKPTAVFFYSRDIRRPLKV